MMADITEEVLAQLKEVRSSMDTLATKADLSAFRQEVREDLQAVYSRDVVDAKLETLRAENATTRKELEDTKTAMLDDREKTMYRIGFGVSLAYTIYQLLHGLIH